MVKLILTLPQLERLKAAASVGSTEWAALDGGKRFGSKVFDPEPISVACTREIAYRLLAVAQQECPDIAVEIYAAIEEDEEQTAR